MRKILCLAAVAAIIILWSPHDTFVSFTSAPTLDGGSGHNDDHGIILELNAPSNIQITTQNSPSNEKPTSPTSEELTTNIHLQAFQAAINRSPLDEVPPELLALTSNDLASLFESKTHIDWFFLSRNGMTEDALQGLLRIWLTGGTEIPTLPSTLNISRESRRAGTPATSVEDLSVFDHTLFVHFKVPDHYQPDAVFIRLTGPQNYTVNHFDRHLLQYQPNEVQEAWFRQDKGWAPGEYQIEVYTAEQNPILLDRRALRIRTQAAATPLSSSPDSKQ